MTHLYQHRIRRPYKRIPLGDNLRPKVEPPDDTLTRVLVFVCAVVVVMVLAGVIK